MTGKSLRNPIIVAVTVAVAAALVGGLLTNLGSWYFALKQPSWKPPDWLFGPAWTTIFACAAAAGVLAWKRADRGADSAKSRTTIIALFAINFCCNSLWSLLFFTLQRPDWALMEVGFLWLSITALMYFLYPLSKVASLLLLPYLLWVSFASVLNWAIVQMNAPFPGV
jgi:translocator protein